MYINERRTHAWPKSCCMLKKDSAYRYSREHDPPHLIPTQERHMGARSFVYGGFFVHFDGSRSDINLLEGVGEREEQMGMLGKETRCPCLSSSAMSLKMARR